MKLFYAQILSLTILLSTGFTTEQSEEIEFVCLKTHKASNACHFNFKVEGAKYRYIDVGCKYNKKRDELIKKVQEGKISLAKDWKIDCPEPKELNN